MGDMIKPKMGLLRITRRDEKFALLRRIVVRLDGEKVGSIASGDTFELELMPSEYRVQVRIDYCSSKHFVFQIFAGQVLHLEASLNGGVLGGAFNSCFNWGNLYRLRPITDKSKRKNEDF